MIDQTVGILFPVEQNLFAVKGKVTTHDQTVAGMNAGKDVYTLMREITLPPELDVGQGYGKVSWSVRAIWENYKYGRAPDPAVRGSGAFLYQSQYQVCNMENHAWFFKGPR